MNEPSEPLKNQDKTPGIGDRIIDKSELPERGILVQQFADSEDLGEGALKIGRQPAP